VHQKLIRAHDNANRPILPGGGDFLPRVYFNLLKVEAGGDAAITVAGLETVFVVQSGVVDISVGGETFTDVGGRADIWSGIADSVYATAGAAVTVRAKSDAEVAVAGGACDASYPAFRIRPDEVEMVDVGSAETHTHRRIFHILGQNAAGRAGNLLVSELLADDGCWSGYPPHKHGEARDGETAHDEVYHYRFRPENGFGGQYCFTEDGEAQVHMTKNGDTFAFADGYHPTVTSPGHEEYIFTILVGHDQRSLVQYFKDEYRPLMSAFPGVQDMIDKFK